MPHYHIAHSQIQKILQKYELGKLVTVTEIATGLINPIYLLNENLILRIDSEEHENANKFKREAVLYEIFPKFNIPAPDLIAFDDSKSLFPTQYILMSYIPGENLLSIFKKLNKQQQKEISFQLGKLTKQIHSIKSKDIGHEDLFENINSWVKRSIGDFETQWHVVNNTNYLSQQEKNDIIITFEKFKKITLSDKGALTHGDFSAGNIQVNEGKIVGIFDFEYAFIADPLWDLQKLPISFQLGESFDEKEFLRGYGNGVFTEEERIRFKMYAYMQGVWEIWATITQYMPFGDGQIQEGVELIQNTMNIDI